MSTYNRSIARSSCTTSMKHAELQSKPPECSLRRIELWVNIKPDALALSFVDHCGMEEEHLTYRELKESYVRTSHFLLDLQGAGLDRGDRCLLAFPPSLEFVVYFLACLEAGVVAVPVIPPIHTRKHDMNTFNTIAQDSKAQCCLTTSTLLKIKKASDITKAMHETLLRSEDRKGKTKCPKGLRWFNVQADGYPSESLNVNGRREVVREYETAPLDTSEVISSASFPAFLQYTSGSTSHPKGVVVTHKNLQHTLGMICNLMKANVQTVCVSWLPMFHDMGLIGSVLGTLYCGAKGILINTANFMKDPSIWVHVMSKERATHTQAPNFAYTLAARKWVALMKEGENYNNEHASLDLSSIQHMINAAEPVTTQAMDAFYSVFCPYGLKKGVVYPTYGLAEHTLCICTNGRTRLVADIEALEREGRLKVVDKLELWAFDVDTSANGGADEEVKVKTLLSSGRVDEAATAGVDIKIVGPKHGGMEAMMEGWDCWEGKSPECCIQCLPHGRVGEIWVNSSSKAMGYWGQPDMTREYFKATTFDMLNNGFSYLRSGDIGLVYGEPPELFVLGRVKDLLIIRGRNHCPQDIEHTAEEACDGALRPGCIAAFNIQTGKEQNQGGVVALVAEVCDSSSMKHDVTKSGDEMNRLRGIVSNIRAAVAAEHGCTLSIVSFVHPRTIPKTTSRKIARQWCARALVMGTLNTICVFSKSNCSDGRTPESDARRDTLFGDKQAATIKVAELDDASILKAIVIEVGHVIKVEPDKISTNAPLSSIGIDSMEIMQLLALLEDRFGKSLPEDALADDEATLESLVSVVRKGGKNLPSCALLFDCAAIAFAQKKEDEKSCISTFENAEITHKQRQKKAHRFALKAKRSTGTFPDGALAAQSHAPPITLRERMLWITALFLFEEKGRGRITFITLMPTALIFGLMAMIQHSTYYVIELSVLFVIALFFIVVRRCGFLSAGTLGLHHLILRDYKIVLEEELPWHQCAVFAGSGVTSEMRHLMSQALPQVTGLRMDPSTGNNYKKLASALNNGRSVLISCTTHAEASIALALAENFGALLVPCTHIWVGGGSQRSPIVGLCAPPILTDKNSSSTTCKYSIIDELMMQAEQVNYRHSKGIRKEA